MSKPMSQREALFWCITQIWVAIAIIGFIAWKMWKHKG